jgi:hypothetical protein
MGSNMPKRQRPTLRLSPHGREQIERARHDKGWTTDDERWLKAATELANPEPPKDWLTFWASNPDNFSPARSTLKNKFLKQQNIRREFFTALCKAVEVDWEKAVDIDNPAEGEPPQIVPFFGRKTTLQQLQKLALDRANCRLIWLFGRAGIGKTAIAYHLIQTPSIIKEFRLSIWLSLESVLPLAELVNVLIGHLSEGKVDRGTLDDLLKYLQQDRYLVILDGWETILESNSIDGYRVGYEDYQDLLQYIGKNHQSCISIVSRERIPSLTLDRIGSNAKVLEVGGLSYPEDRDFLTAEGLSGSEIELKRFVEIYHNPLMLKLIADRVRTIHGGKIATLVTDDASIYTNHDLVKIIEAEFRHLGELEQSIVYWLAIWRNSINYQQLYDSLIKDVSKIAIDEALYSLISQRSLVRTNPQSEYYLESVTLKQITNLFVKNTVKELSNSLEKKESTRSRLIVSHALKIGDDDEIGLEQIRRIVRSIIEQLLKKYPPKILKDKLEQMQSHLLAGYAPINLQTILTQLKYYSLIGK